MHLEIGWNPLMEPHALYIKLRDSISFYFAPLNSHPTTQTTLPVSILSKPTIRAEYPLLMLVHTEKIINNIYDEMGVTGLAGTQGCAVSVALK